jgi:hypothetical protein
MKKYIILILLFFIAKFTFSQYRPLPMQNAEWICSGAFNLLSTPTSINYMHYTYNDTLIGSTIYVNIKKVEIPPVNDVNTYQTYTGAIRQDTLNKKIYIVPTDSTSEKLLYDFSLNVGDTVVSFLNETCPAVETIGAIDSIIVNGNYHKRFHIQGGCSGIQIYYIEGIGSNFGLIFPNNTGNLSNLICTKVNNQTYFPDSSTSCDLVTSVTNLDIEMGIDIYPNPSNNEINIIIPDAEGSTANIITLFSPLGQILITEKINSKKSIIDISELPKGLYMLSISVNENIITKKIIKQ